MEPTYEFEPIKDWTDREKLEKEKEVIGFYLSAHPLETYQKQLSWFNPVSFKQTFELSKNYAPEQTVTAIGCGLLKSRKDIVTKKGDRMAFIQLEDVDGTAEVILFPKTFAKVEKWLDNHQIFIVKGMLDLTATSQCKIKANELVPIELVLQEWAHLEKISLEFPPNIKEGMLQQLQDKILAGKTPLELIFHENGKKIRLQAKKRIALDEHIAQELNKLNINIKCYL